MRFRSLSHLRRELLARWLDSREVQLVRVGSRVFEIAPPGEQTSGFVFDHGWVFEDVPAGSVRGEPGRSRFLGWLVLAVFLSLALGAGFFASMASKSPTSEPVESSVSDKSHLTGETSKPASECNLDSAPPRPVSDGQRLSSGESVKLIHDITIGGERQQEVELVCGSDSVAADDPRFMLAYWLDEGIWKAKSATPLGSHSRFTTN